MKGLHMENTERKREKRERKRERERVTYEKY